MVLIRDKLLYFRLRTTRYAHALPSSTPKDTLLTLNTCIRRDLAAALQCARPCIGVTLTSHPLQSASRRPGTGKRFRCAITQSISLSNIQTFSSFREKARPEAVETCRYLGLFPNRRHSAMAAIGKQRISFWWS